MKIFIINNGHTDYEAFEVNDKSDSITIEMLNTVEMRTDGFCEDEIRDFISFLKEKETTKNVSFEEMKLQDLMDDMEDYIECWKCHARLHKDNLVYSACIVPYDGDNIVGDLKNKLDAIGDVAIFTERYKSDKDIKNIELSGAYCPHCINCQD